MRHTTYAFLFTITPSRTSPPRGVTRQPNTALSTLSIGEVLTLPSQDIEAQKHNVPATYTTETAPTYARAGRGGAGNFLDPSTLPDAKTVEQVAEKTLSAVAASVAKPKAGWSGRGGAGNYSESPSAAQEADQKKKVALEQKVLVDVEAGLAPPPKAHTGVQRESA